jgi:hypothetical protein
LLYDSDEKFGWAEEALKNGNSMQIRSITATMCLSIVPKPCAWMKCKKQFTDSCDHGILTKIFDKGAFSFAEGSFEAQVMQMKKIMNPPGNSPRILWLLWIFWSDISH